ncbi:MAG: hypothetical protein ACK5LR_10155 [Mangrovibacterium sp.]
MKQFGLFISALILFSASLFGHVETMACAPSPSVQLEASSVVEDYWFIYDQSEHQAIAEVSAGSLPNVQLNKLAFDFNFSGRACAAPLVGRCLQRVKLFTTFQAQSYLFKILFPFHWFS